MSVAKCSECGYQWKPRSVGAPLRCPDCGVRFSYVKEPPKSSSLTGCVGCLVLFVCVFGFLVWWSVQPAKDAGRVAGPTPALQDKQPVEPNRPEPPHEEPPKKKPDDFPRAEAGVKWVKLGSVFVSVMKAQVGPVKYTEARQAKTTNDAALKVRLKVWTDGQSKPINYLPWRTSSNLPPPTVVDNLGNEYNRLQIENAEAIEGLIAVKQVRFGYPIEDILLVQPPVGDAAYLDLDLPGTAVGLTTTDVFRFRIPKEMWSKK